MRKRNIQIIIRLDKDEHQRLCKLVKKSGLSQEAYIRHLIDGVVPNDAPPPDYFSMMKELHGIGNNLNQIAQKAHVLNVIDVQRYDENMRLFNQTVRKITNTVILPRRNE
jgi:predicted DNA-binding protein